MLLIEKSYQNTTENLSDIARNKANQIANVTLKAGKLKGSIIANAISKAKEVIADYNAKRINNVKIYTLE